MPAPPMSNLQLELLKLYSTNLGEDDVLAIKGMLARYFAQKAIVEADNMWEKKGLSNDTMDKWLNE
jgi:hypothetical protein